MGLASERLDFAVVCFDDSAALLCFLHFGPARNGESGTF